MSMDPLLPPFAEAVQLALGDEGSRHNVQDALNARHALRARAWPPTARLQSLREQARLIRQRTITHLDEQVATLVARAQSNGFHVVKAATSEDAVAYIVGLLKDLRPRTVAFAQSEVLEEIGLWRALGEHRFPLVHVDMAAYLLHKMDDLPAHPVMPLAHLSLRDITAVWEEITGHTVRPQARTLVDALRNHIMPLFRRADVGIVTPTFAVAETGSLVLAEDEGHIAHTLAHVSTLVVVMSLNQVVERWVDLPPLLETRNRSRTGEPVSRHTVILRAPGSGLQAHHVHLVLVDNGRSQWNEWGFGEVLMCVGCGACADVSPVIQTVGGQVYNSPYMGGIGTVVSALLWPSSHGEIAHLTPPCPPCRAACPLDIPLDELHERVRRWLPREQHGRLARLMGLVSRPSPAIDWGLTDTPLLPEEEFPVPREAPHFRSPVERLVHQLVSHGLEVYTAESHMAARLHLVGALNTLNVDRVIGWNNEELELEIPGLLDALSAVGISYVGPEDALTREGQYTPAWARARASVLVADAAVAETGSLVLSVGRGRPLAALTNARALFVFVPADRLFPTWEDWERAWTGNLVILSGPTGTRIVGGKEVRPGFGAEHIHVILTRDTHLYMVET